MFKKVLTVSLVCGMIFQMAGCQLNNTLEVDKPSIEIKSELSNIETDSNEEDVVYIAPPVVVGFEAPVDLSEDVYSYQVNIDDVIYQVPIFVSDFEDMGWVCDSRYTDIYEVLQPNQRDLFMFSRGNGDSVVVSIINLDNKAQSAKECVICEMKLDVRKISVFEVEFPGNIKLRESTKEEVVEAYGTPTREEETDSTIIYIYRDGDNKQFCFTFSKREYENLTKVDVMKIGTPKRFKESGIDLYPGEDLESYYIKPEALSKNPEDYTFELEGYIYKLPCPISEFLNNGWEIVEKESPETVNGYGEDRVVLKYKKNKMEWRVANYSPDKEFIDYCFVTGNDTSISMNSFNLKVFEGVEIGTSAEDAWKILEPKGFIRDNQGEGVGSVYLEGDRRVEYSIHYYEGVIDRIAIKNDPARDKYADILKENYNN